ncbi:helix-turn-helix transcriptional regulator [Paenibacillus sp. 11B]|uniref:helix-turn-helix domain-containing protein n=1 Tax=unclassified Paenibacillus TaxID=185978 RepID=UPI00264D0022|nr:helix-turn-helix transcriptional regulator [Paenibacillus sp. 11B]MDN8590978.1 helix-turn-helix transcriptional regulator [Paenibacillus sp. 11B]
MRLGYTLDEAGVSKNALAREAKVRPNLIYDLCEGKTKRLDLDTLNNIVNTLRAMTGNGLYSSPSTFKEKPKNRPLLLWWSYPCQVDR